MEIAIIGLPQCGKTTIFNAATRGSAEVVAYANKPNIGVAKVPDKRLDVLEGMFNPRRTVHAEVMYVDIPAAPEGLGKTQGISGEYLNFLQRADALLIVARSFQDPSVPHVAESLDAFRDIDTMLYELTFADLEILERRLQRVADGFKGAGGAERDALTREQALLDRIKNALEGGTHLRDQSLTDDEKRLLSGFQFLTSKPLIVVVNAGEDQLDQIADMEARLTSDVEGTNIKAAALCGKLEMELAQMGQDEEEEADFRASMGVVGESGLNRMISMSYSALNLVSFLTVGEDEVRAWPITRDMHAQQAAGKIHTDLERGFIRGEVVTYDDLCKYGTLAEARKKGVLRQEGKTYPVQDGDIMNILFNV
ncbi:MAG: redox-regulated ATPase YchF [Chloroflexi bacterium]|nr:redox-regulated ATPase YchF [Chloroflexota bacterium]